MPRPRLLHVTTTDISLELLLGPQLSAFAAAGFEVMCASAPGPYVAAIEARGLVHYPLRHLTRASDLRSDGVAFFEMVSLFRRLRPDIVHTHNPKPGVLGRVAARAAGVPAVVNTVHGLYAQNTDPLKRRIAVYSPERLAASFSHCELVQSREDLDTLARLGVGTAKLVELGNGVDLDRFEPARFDSKDREALLGELGITPDRVVIGVVGRLVLEKGYAEVFDAARYLTSSDPGVKFVVVGPRDDTKADSVSDEMIERASSSGAVVFAGERPDVERFYNAFDVYLLASHREGFPRSAMEAAAMALPVIASDIRGCRQVVDDNKTGFLFPKGDLKAMLEAIRRLARSGELRRQMGSAARAKALSDFDQRRVIDVTLRSYERLLGRSRAGPSGA